MKDWKSILLATGEFKDNEYLDLYINIISGISAPASYMENHHVIPVAYYKYKYNLTTNSSKLVKEARKCADNDPQNSTVLLSFVDHCKAHWLLSKCTTKLLAASSATAFMRQVSVLKKLDTKFCVKKHSHIIDLGLTDEEYSLLQQYIEDIKVKSQKYWSAEQDEWLRLNRPTHTAKYCADYLGKTERAVYSRCSVLGINRVWHTEETDNELIEYSRTHTAKECSEYFDVSEAYVVKRWRELGFSKADYYEWTEEKDQWLRDNDSKYTVAQLAEKLGTSKTTVMGRRWTLGITRWERSREAKRDRYAAI